MAEEEHEGASTKELLIEACRRNNTDLLTSLLQDKPDSEIATLLNRTVTVMGNHLYHEAASQGNYEIIDLLLDQPDFECDPISRLEGDSPLHSAIRWLNAEPPAQREFGQALIEMMLEAGSNPRLKNKGGLTAYHLVDPSNKELRDLIQKHEYTGQNAGDFIEVSSSSAAAAAAAAAAPARNAPLPPGAAPPPPPPPPPPGAAYDAESDFDEDAEFSGSDEEERAEWDRRRLEKKNRK